MDPTPANPPTEIPSQIEKPDGNERLRITLSWIVVVSVTLFSLFAIGILIKQGFRPGAYSELYFSVLRDHFRAVAGLPMAAVAALFIVLVLRATSGPIELEALWLKFKGASGPIILWLLCFLGIAHAIESLW